MQCEYYALEGLSGLVSTIEQIRDSVNPRLEIEGILRTMFDPRNNLSNDVAAQLIQHFGDRVFRTIIPRNVRLAEAPSFGVPAMLHDKESRGALAYLALAGEMIRRSEEPEAYAAEAAPAAEPRNPDTVERPHASAEPNPVRLRSESRAAEDTPLPAGSVPYLTNHNKGTSPFTEGARPLRTSRMRDGVRSRCPMSGMNVSARRDRTRGSPRPE